MNDKPVIALDADGVLLDYHRAYQIAWGKAFGSIPEVLDPEAYWPQDMFNVRHLQGKELEHFRSHFDDQFWESVPAMPGAVEACHRLTAAGYDLVCVSAFSNKRHAARTKNLKDCGFPIERVIATESDGGARSPKAAALEALQPVAFVDDFLPYLRGIPQGIHAALIVRHAHGSPNVGQELALAQSKHQDLLAFANWWLQKQAMYGVKS